jgi:hypothetical protein
MSVSPRISVRVPSSFREQLAATAAADQRTLSALVVSLLDRGVVERALFRASMSKES